jgi:glucan phosphorylase
LPFYAGGFGSLAGDYIKECSGSIMLTGGAFLDPSVLTLGFARRFATYKRHDILAP